LIVTNHHVIATAHGIRATRLGGEKLEVAGVLAQDEARDIAILKVDGSGFPFLKLGTSSGLTDGVEVVVIGSPMGLSWTTSSGIVSAIREHGVPEQLKASRNEAGPLIQITAAISPGSSGSPVVTLDSMVVGVADGRRHHARCRAAAVSSFSAPQPVHLRGVLCRPRRGLRPRPRHLQAPARQTACGQALTRPLPGLGSDSDVTNGIDATLWS